MKKSFILAMAAAAMLTACSSNDELNKGGEANLSQQKIQLGVSNSASVQTRGTGTVGDLDGEQNVWAGQELFVYMLNKGEMSLGLYKNPDEMETEAGTAVYDNTKFFAPTGTDQDEAKTQDGSIAYYPVSGNYDFWGYHVDDAAQGEPYMVDAEGNRTDNAEEAAKRVIDVEIDGSQDIMTGKAVPTQADIEALGGKKENFFSAYASRKGVQPNITFNHNLARFTFEVRAGSKGTCGDNVTEAVRVKGISVKSKVDGQLTVAYKGETPESVLEFPGQFDDVAQSLKLMQRSADGELDHNKVLEPLQEVPLTWNEDEDQANVIKVGEALLVAPGETSYPFTVDLLQKIQKNVNGIDTDELALQQNTVITMKNGKTFEAGKSYKVTITVYGLERIVVTATLVPWQDGGSIDIDDDREDGSSYTE